MTANNARTRKAKGRNACAEVRDAMLKMAVHLEPEDIKVTPSSVTGEDLWLSPLARSVYPVTLEVKCQEKLNFWSAIAQAEAHSKKNGHKYVMAFKRNHQKLRCVIDFEEYLWMLIELYSLRKSIDDDRDNA